MLPQAIFPPLELIIQSLAALALDQTFTFAIVFDNNNTEFLVNFPFAIPVAAGCADLDFGRKNQFFAHIGCG